MYQTITIERQYASGGNDIGRRLAEELGYTLYDRNLLTLAAKDLKIPSIYIEGLEETHSGGFLFNLSKTALGGNASDKHRPMSEQLFLAEKRIIQDAAEKGGCVIVGRAASFILKDRADCLSVFISCDKNKRIERAIEKEGLSASNAEEILKKTDKRRSGFFNAVTRWEWGSPEYFAMCLDSGKLGQELCVRLLCEAAKR